MKTRTTGERENYLKCVEFGYPEWIPIKFELMPALWIKYGDGLQQIVDRHPGPSQLHRYLQRNIEDEIQIGDFPAVGRDLGLSRKRNAHLHSLFHSIVFQDLTLFLFHRNRTSLVSSP